MAIKLECPPSSLLAELIQGKLAEPELSEWSGHLEECSTCQEKAKTASPNDTLVASLRGQAPVEDELAGSVPPALLAQLKQIPDRDGSSRSDTNGFSCDTDVSLSDEKFDFLAPPQDLEELGRLGPYRVLQVLGRGGMGVVFLAEDPKLARRVALKAMLPRFAANPRARERFLREARAAARLKNDHIVTIYQVEEDRGVPYLAMELLEGQPLDAVLRGSRQLGAAEIVRIGRDVAQGLVAAHAKGLVHRDIKPANLWLERTSVAVARVKILDFGLAHLDAEGSNFTQAGAILGTPAYMAPEQARGHKDVDARADLFSLGCVLYRLCAGESPFKADTTMATLMAVVLDDPSPLAGKNEAIPRELAELIMQLLAKDPSQRPQTAAEVLERLAAIEHALPSLPTEPTTSDATPPKTAAAGRPPANYVPLAFALGGLVFAAGIVLAAIFFWQTPDGRVVRVECDDPAVKIAFADGELKVTGAYKEPVIVRPGRVALQIVRQGVGGEDFKFETDKLIVNQGDKIVLKIELLEGKVQLVQAGKGVIDSKVLTPVKRDPWEESVARMEPADQVAAVKAQLKKLSPEFDETSLSARIANLGVVAVEIKDAAALKDLSPLRGFTGLKELYLESQFGGSVDLGPLRGMKLEKLISNGCTFGNLSPLAGMPLIRVGCWGCTTTDLSPLSGMKLVEVNVGNSRVRDISVLKGMPLEFVCLNISQVEDLSPLAGAPIKTMMVANAKAKSLKPLTNAPIQWLTIDGTPIEDLTPLLSMPLVKLEMDNPRQHADLLRKIPTLKTINFKPVAEALGDVAESPDVDRRAARWVLSIGGAVRINGEDHEIKAPTELPQERFALTGVNLNGKHVTNAGLANLRDLKGLTLLYLDGTPVTDAGLAHLKDLTGLRHLALYGDQVTNAGLAHFQNCKGLLRLELGCTLATDAGLAHFKDCKELTFLGLSSLELTNDGLAPLKGLPELVEISLYKTPLSDAGLAHLKDLKRLKSLELRETKVTDAGMAEFHTSLPHCKILHDRGSIEAKD